MLSSELMRSFRRLQLRARRLVQGMLDGQYHSAFKGAGLAFEDVREYQPGDDIRGIDWNVTARAGSPFIKRYIEEREQTVLIALDASGSMRFGTRSPKRVMATHLAALIAFSAADNGDRVGLAIGTDSVEEYLAPERGARHTLRLLRDVLHYVPRSSGTSLRVLVEQLQRVQRRRAVVFLFSDFLDDGFDVGIRQLGRKHDLILTYLTDPREEAMPDVGLVQLEDAETNRQLLIDTRSPQWREQFAQRSVERRERVERLARSAKADVIVASTADEQFEALRRFFYQRERRSRHGQ